MNTLIHTMGPSWHIYWMMSIAVTGCPMKLKRPVALLQQWSSHSAQSKWCWGLRARAHTHKYTHNDNAQESDQNATFTFQNITTVGWKPCISKMSIFSGPQEKQTCFSSKMKIHFEFVKWTLKGFHEAAGEFAPSAEGQKYAWVFTWQQQYVRQDLSCQNRWSYIVDIHARLNKWSVCVCMTPCVDSLSTSRTSLAGDSDSLFDFPSPVNNLLSKLAKVIQCYFWCCSTCNLCIMSSLHRNMWE